MKAQKKDLSAVTTRESSWTRVSYASGSRQTFASPTARRTARVSLSRTPYFRRSPGSLPATPLSLSVPLTLPTIRSAKGKSFRFRMPCSREIKFSCHRPLLPETGNASREARPQKAARPPAKEPERSAYKGRPRGPGVPQLGDSKRLEVPNVDFFF